MSTELETLKELREKDVARAEAAEAAKSKADELLKLAQEAMAKLQSESEQVKAKLVETEKILAETSSELKGLYAEQQKTARVATAKDKLKLSDVDAREFVTSNEGITDEAFAKQSVRRGAIPRSTGQGRSAGPGR